MRAIDNRSGDVITVGDRLFDSANNLWIFGSIADNPKLSPTGSGMFIGRVLVVSSDGSERLLYPSEVGLRIEDD